MSGKICIIGDFGQAKLSTLYDELAKRGYDNILCADINGNKLKHKINALKAMKNCKTVISMVSKEQIKTIYKGASLFKCDVYNFVTACDLGEYAKCLNSFKVNFAEFSALAEKLESQGITNCEVVPPFNSVDTRVPLTVFGENKFLTVGVNSIEAVEIEAKYNRTHDEAISVDVFDRSKRLGNYLALVCKGNVESDIVIAAYSYGLPVIAGDDAYAKEMIRNFETGWIYPDEKAKTLYDSIAYAVKNKDEMINMRKNCKLLATRYSSNYVVPRIIENYLK